MIERWNLYLIYSFKKTFLIKLIDKHIWLKKTIESRFEIKGCFVVDF